jgi:ribosomal protein S18 acetylase RimI-like enzyme
MAIRTVSIRDMIKDDLDTVLGIQSRAYSSFYHESRKVLQSKFMTFPAGCKLALVNGKPVAYIFSHPWVLSELVKLDKPITHLPQKPEVLYIHDLAVDPDYKGMGIGRELISSVKEVALSFSLPKLMLVSVQNSSGFWEKHGFKITNKLTKNIKEQLRSYGTETYLMTSSYEV